MRPLDPMRLEVLSQGGRVGVGLVAASGGAVVWLVGGVDVHVLLSVAGVCKPSVAAVDLALKRLLPWKECKL